MKQILTLMNYVKLKKLQTKYVMIFSIRITSHVNVPLVLEKLSIFTVTKQDGPSHTYAHEHDVKESPIEVVTKSNVTSPWFSLTLY